MPAHWPHVRLSQSASAGCKRRPPSERSFYRRGGRNLEKKKSHHLAVAPHGAPPAEVGKSSVGSMPTPLIGKRGRWKRGIA